MSMQKNTIQFSALAQRPADGACDWLFVVLPKAVSEALPRRGRTTVTGTLNGQPFQITLEPDGRLSHWLKVERSLRQAAAVTPGEQVAIELMPLQSEPDPPVPADLRAALQANPAARAVWDATTALARVDWVHWVESAKQSATRQKRIVEACDKLAAGQRRVCCFDASGYYSKALRPPEAAQ